MKFNKDRFLKSELGGTLQEVIQSWDLYITMRTNATRKEDRIAAAGRATQCQAQWEIYEIMFRQFYSMEGHFMREENYCGVTLDHEWLFKIERDLNFIK